MRSVVISVFCGILFIVYKSIISSVDIRVIALKICVRRRCFAVDFSFGDAVSVTLFSAVVRCSESLPPGVQNPLPCALFFF